MSSCLWVGGCWYSNATLRAYVGKDRLDEIVVGDLGTLSRQMEISVEWREERAEQQNRTYSESREMKPDNEQGLEGEIPRDVI